MATVSSGTLGRAAGASDAQVRKDLRVVGAAGQPGVGYDAAALADAIRGTLGVRETWRAVLVGAGNIGRALAAYDRLGREGFEIAAILDRAPGIVGRTVGRLEVLPMSALAEVVRRQGIGIGVIAVPPDQAQEVAEALVESGVRGILNFAPRRLELSEGIPVVDVDFRSALERLVLAVSQRGPAGGAVPQRRRRG
jgi:redox-sensing transcriptional repressor